MWNDVVVALKRNPKTMNVFLEIEWIFPFYEEFISMAGKWGFGVRYSMSLDDACKRNHFRYIYLLWFEGERESVSLYMCVCICNWAAIIRFIFRALFSIFHGHLFPRIWHSHLVLICRSTTWILYSQYNSLYGFMFISFEFSFRSNRNGTYSRHNNIITFVL